MFAGFPAIVPSSVLGRDGAVAPSEKITVGFLGTGSHGIHWNLRAYLDQPDAQVLAVCDVDSNHLTKAQAMVNQKYGNTTVPRPRTSATSWPARTSTP
jgi:predicted dehydrogenase